MGEKLRNREKRVKYFTRSVAILATKVIFRCFDTTLTDLIQRELLNRIQKYGTQVIEDMVNVVGDWVNYLIQDKSAYGLFMEQVFILGADVEYLPVRRSQLIHYKDHYLTLVRELGGTFREVFADVCMLYLLQIESISYIKLFEPELNRVEDDEDSGEHKREMFYLRMYVCLRACGMKFPPEAKELRLLQEEMKLDDEPENRLVPLSVISQLESYAKECYESFGKNSFPELDELQKSFRNVSSSSMDYRVFRKDIEDYRKLLIEKWKAKSEPI